MREHNDARERGHVGFTYQINLDTGHLERIIAKHPIPFQPPMEVRSEERWAFKVIEPQPISPEQIQAFLDTAGETGT